MYIYIIIIICILLYIYIFIFFNIKLFIFFNIKLFIYIYLYFKEKTLNYFLKIESNKNKDGYLKYFSAYYSKEIKLLLTNIFINYNNQIV